MQTPALTLRVTIQNKRTKSIVAVLYGEDHVDGEALSRGHFRSMLQHIPASKPTDIFVEQYVLLEEETEELAAKSDQRLIKPSRTDADCWTKSIFEEFRPCFDMHLPMRRTFSLDDPRLDILSEQYRSLCVAPFKARIRFFQVDPREAHFDMLNDVGQSVDDLEQSDEEWEENSNCVFSLYRQLCQMLLRVHHVSLAQYEARLRQLLELIGAKAEAILSAVPAYSTFSRELLDAYEKYKHVHRKFAQMVRQWFTPEEIERIIVYYNRYPSTEPYYYLSPIMDVYTIARMRKVFKEQGTKLVLGIFGEGHVTHISDILVLLDKKLELVSQKQQPFAEPRVECDLTIDQVARGQWRLECGTWSSTAPLTKRMATSIKRAYSNASDDVKLSFLRRLWDPTTDQTTFLHQIAETHQININTPSG